jgi:UDP-N-acetylmuramate--alanine ligase
VITNLEPDHLDHHGTAEAYTAVFDQFVDRIEPGGFLIACADDPGTAALADRVQLRRTVRYGRSATASVRLSGHTVVLADGREVALRLTVPGEHMLLNATAALAAGVELGVDPELLVAGLAGYTGVRRRFELKGTAAGITVYDDYAHHPTEVAAQLTAARAVVGAGRLVVVFQPHLYSRTATFAVEFGDALAAADLAVVLDVYGAREDPQPGVTGELVAAAIGDRTAVLYQPDRRSAAAFVADVLRAGDLVITMGAGDVTAIGPELLARLQDSEGGRPT